ncbi:MAG: DUF4347 domain-containing protein [Blastocatellia bacterium]
MATPNMVDVYFIDRSKLDFVMAADGLVTDGDRAILSVKDLVSKCDVICSKGDRIRELRIFGHGNTKGQYFGADWVDETTLSKYHFSFRRLSRCFDSMSFITLGGCKVGQAENFLCRLSKLVGVPVMAWTAMQRPLFPGDEGAEVRCFRYACTRGDKVGFDYLDN